MVVVVVFLLCGGEDEATKVDKEDDEEGEELVEEGGNGCHMLCVFQTRTFFSVCFEVLLSVSLWVFEFEGS